MTRQRYSIKEAVNRILRSWEGIGSSNDQPGTLSGEILSEDGAISDFAELMAGSLPGKSGSIPSDISITGTVRHSNEYGHIFSSYATADVAGNYPSGTFSTLPVFASGSYSSDLVDNDFSNDRLVLNSAGHYLIWFNLSANAAADGDFIIHAFLGGVVQGQACVRFNPLTVLGTGTYSLGSVGILQVSSVPSYLDLRVLPDTTGTFNVTAAALVASKLW